jgi:hypothetical protein
MINGHDIRDKKEQWRQCTGLRAQEFSVIKMGQKVCFVKYGIDVLVILQSCFPTIHLWLRYRSLKQKRNQNQYLGIKSLSLRFCICGSVLTQQAM